jgi:hypothetical protein
MPEQANDPNEYHRNRHFERCNPELRKILEDLDRVLCHPRFDVKSVRWEPELWVSYFIPQRHLWVQIHPYWTHLGLSCRIELGDFEQSALVKELGVPEFEKGDAVGEKTDMRIERHEYPTGMNHVVVRIKEGFNPNSKEFRKFLEDTLASALKVWGINEHG